VLSWKLGQISLRRAYCRRAIQIHRHLQAGESKVTDKLLPTLTTAIKLNRNNFFEQRDIEVRASDYSTESVLQILDEMNANTLISFNNSEGQTFVNVHCAFLEACRKSKNCKRFIPSEFAGNIDDFPLSPSYFKSSRVPFREILNKETDIEWTIFNNGWLMDYFLVENKTYMPAIPNEFPIDPNNWKACIRGSGDQVQSFTSGQDIAKALIMLLSVPEWVSYTIEKVLKTGFSHFVGTHNLHHWPMVNL
jgi:hypothetical protein